MRHEKIHLGCEHGTFAFERGAFESVACRYRCISRHVTWHLQDKLAESIRSTWMLN